MLRCYRGLFVFIFFPQRHDVENQHRDVIEKFKSFYDEKFVSYGKLPS